MPKSPTLLALFAHPDDEAFVVSGTLAEMAARGVHVALICATRGEAGEISDPRLATAETLGAVREAELRQAVDALGLDELIFLDYRDSGMVDTPDNAHPDAFINARSTEVVRRLTAEIRRLQPDVMLTFEPYGGYGHPDHQAIHNHSVAALFAAAGSAYYPELGAPWQTARLFQTGIPHSFFTRLRARLNALGEDVSKMPDPDARAPWPGPHPTTVRNVAPFVEQKWQAIRAHKTQVNSESLFARLPTAEIKAVMAEEVFVQVYPPTVGDAPPADLFADLRPATAGAPTRD